jgi:DNA-binding NarL/FixJ family response regulator
VLIADLSGILADIVTQLIEAQPDLALVGSVPRGENVLAAVGAARPHVVVLGLDTPELPAAGLELLRAFPAMRLLCVTRNGRSGLACELRPHQVVLNNLSPDGLLKAVRAAGAAEAPH